MLILAIDTSSVLGSIAVARDAKLLDVASAPSLEGFSTRLFREVEFLTGELGIGLDDIDLYAVNAGPGSFTGLRVGLTAVKAWAEVYQRPIAAVSGLAAVAAQCGGMASKMLGGQNVRTSEVAGEGIGEPPVQDVRQHIVPVLDARRGQVYGGVYRRTAEALETCGEGCVMAATEFLCELHKRFGRCEATFVTPDPELLRIPLEQSEFSGSQLEVASSVLAPWIADLGLAQERRGACVDALQLEANYIRRADAELRGANS
jgi:tRNA threonylcarbamoyladenosine biosynthesis protein TsaB